MLKLTEMVSVESNLQKYTLDIKGPLTLTETETDKNGLYEIVWRCSYCTETLIPLGTVAILSVSVSVNIP